MLAIMSRYRKRYQQVPQEPVTVEDKSSKTRMASPAIILTTGLLASLLVVVLLMFNVGSTQDVPVIRPNLTLEEITTLRENHEAMRLNRQQVNSLSSSVSIDILWDALRPMLVARPPGSVAIHNVGAHIVQTLTLLGGWEFEFDSFYAKPPDPYNQTLFSNIIASSNPDAERKLILACHYDSKILPNGDFIAATDSAVPCAMMLEIARVLNGALQEHKARLQLGGSDDADIGVELVFFDGEEAFVDWTATDSIYGARHLAKEWRGQTRNGVNRLQRIDLFVLLDLIGADNTQFANFIKTQTAWYNHASDIESRLFGNDRNHVPAFPSHSKWHYYRRQSIEDDHIPFLRRGVPIMHLISVPFPRVWHTLDDNEDNLDRPRIKAITQLVTVFVAEYMGLTPQTA